ncbi:hypothetical protein FOZ60_013268 [Perkinsus olseni]|uniref:Uncharacterized protein n=1 Tax=Perkinsus olseni TaxID=32597 RepID=A0A7J6NAM5_PEROL|nr:hypothetical protein FOZ60_013268 [Perkinsus olseni]
MEKKSGEYLPSRDWFQNRIFLGLLAKYNSNPSSMTSKQKGKLRAMWTAHSKTVIPADLEKNTHHEDRPRRATEETNNQLITKYFKISGAQSYYGQSDRVPMAPVAEYGAPITTLTVNFQNLGVWPKELKGQLQDMLGVRLVETYTNKKTEAKIYKVFKCQDHEGCAFRVKTNYVPPDAVEVMTTVAGHTGNPIRAQKSIPVHIMKMIEELTPRYGAMRVYAELRTRLENTFEEFLRSIAEEDGRAPIESGRDRLMKIIGNKRRYFLNAQQEALTDLEEVVEGCMKLGYTTLSAELLQAVSQDLHGTSILGRFDRKLVGDSFLLAPDKVRETGCVVLSSRVGLVTWFNTTHPQESPLLRPETKRVGITVGLDGCFKGARGGVCLIVIGPVHPTRKPSPGSSVKVGFSLAPVLAVIAKNETSGVVEKMVNWLDDLGHIFHGEARLRITASITDASQALVKDLEVSLDNVHSLRCQYHLSESVKKSELSKAAKAFVATWIEAMYRCAGRMVSSKLQELLLAYIRENYGEKDEKHCRISWARTKGVMHLPCPVDLLMNDEVPTKSPVFNNTCENTFSCLRAFVGRKPPCIGGTGGMLENTRKFLIGYGEGLCDLWTSQL